MTLSEQLRVLDGSQSIVIVFRNIELYHGTVLNAHDYHSSLVEIDYVYPTISSHSTKLVIILKRASV